MLYDIERSPCSTGFNKHSRMVYFDSENINILVDSDFKEILSFYKIDKEALKANIKNMQSKPKNSQEYLLYKKALEVLISPGDRKERKVLIE